MAGPDSESEFWEIQTNLDKTTDTIKLDDLIKKQESEGEIQSRSQSTFQEEQFQLCKCNGSQISPSSGTFSGLEKQRSILESRHSGSIIFEFAG